MIEGMAGANLNDQPFFEISLALLFRTAYCSDMTFTTSLSNKDFLMITLKLIPHDRDSASFNWTGNSLTHCAVNMLRHFDDHLEECADEEILGDLLEGLLELHNGKGDHRTAKQSTMCGNGFDLVMIDE